ncbi:MAG: hypothetical protein IT381_32070 [Deltaproteobacteria bacterium]|nr:hypothetical protein [Deltaproteobacteria bacterium]
MHPSASPNLTWLFAAVVALTAGGFLALVWRYDRPSVAKAAGGLLAWFVVFGAVSSSGVLARFDARPPPFAFVLLSVLGGGVWLGRSSFLQRLLAKAPLWTIVLYMGFRLPLELVMHLAASEGTMPVEMSYSGYNFDIVTGASAMAVAIALRLGAPLCWPHWRRMWRCSLGLHDRVR